VYGCERSTHPSTAASVPTKAHATTRRTTGVRTPERPPKERYPVMFTPGIRQLRAFPIIAIVLFAAACGGSSASPRSAAPGADPYGGARSSAKGSAPGAAIVMVSKSQSGQIIADGSGRSVYLFEKDQHHKSSCYADCATVWPPLITDGLPTAGAGATTSLLGTTSRTDGNKQVTYNGHPLYYYVSDGNQQGSIAGEGLDQFGAKWYLLSPTGTTVETDGF
jgi:predicted lipoprotein with Yx(FWY)xxD motif